MQEDTIGRAIELLGIGDGDGKEAALEIETRAVAMLQVALKALDVRAGRERAVALVGEAFDVIAAPEHEQTVLAIAATPAEQLAATLLGFLRQRDPMDPAQAVSGHDDAGAMILAGIAFLQERHGTQHMTGYVGNLVRAVQETAAAGQEPVSKPATIAPKLPPPAGIRNLTSSPRAGLSMKERINVMSDFLRGSVPAEAQSDALASIMASALFLRERFGEPYAVGAIRQVEGVVSQAAALDRWNPEGAARN